MTYENPSDFLNEEKEKKKNQRKWSINKALKLAEKRKTKEEKTDMDTEDLINTAEKIYNFISPTPSDQ